MAVRSPRSSLIGSPRRLELIYDALVTRNAHQSIWRGQSRQNVIAVPPL